MLDLANFLAQNPQYLQLGAAESILAVINTKSVDKTDSELQTFRIFVHRFGLDFATRVLGVLDLASKQNALLKATYMAVCTTGLDFTNDQIREQIDFMASEGLWSQNDANLIKSLGIYKISPVEAFFGQGQTAILAEVNTALIVAGRKQLLLEVADKYNNLATAIKGGVVSTWDEAKTFFAQ